MNVRNFIPAAIFLASLAAPCVLAEVRLPKILSSHMILQRDQPIHIWGWSDPDEKVSIAFHGLTRRATGDRLGRWSVFFPPQPAGGPFELKVTGSNAMLLEDVLIGDVWFASGQSNMEMPLKGFPGSAVINNSTEEISRANQPEIRLLRVRERPSDYPLGDYDDSWTTCTPETAAEFSAVAYFFGRDLGKQEHVPIGLIDSSWGGTPAEAWVSFEGLSSDASLMPVFAAYANFIDDQAKLQLVLEAEKREEAAARRANRPPAHHPWRPDPRSWAPAALYNGMVAPAVNYPIKGVIWYQGESNTDPARAPVYAKLFPALIADWRTHWHEGDFPFLFVQIANFNAGSSGGWPIVREAQRRTLSTTATGMAVTIDIGNPENIHPADKQTVGARLALAARALGYGDNIEYSGPRYRSASTAENGLRVWFDHVDQGLVARAGSSANSAIAGFEIAGDDHKFSAAAARIDGKSVLVTNPQIKAPRYVRYGWQDAPVLNLSNSAQLPTSPFTSEDQIPAP